MRWTFLIATVAVSGCGASEVEAPRTPVDETSLDVVVVALSELARPLDPVVARISNRSAAVVYENLCGGELEGFGYVPNQWNGSIGYGRGCYIEDPLSERYLRPIPPGSSVLDTFYINALAYAGEWRFNFDLQDADGETLPLSRRVSQPFRVVR